MADSELQILRSEAGVFRDAREHLWADLIIIVKGEHEVGPIGAPKCGRNQIAA
jgi:hypothetical protein